MLSVLAPVAAGAAAAPDPVQPLIVQRVDERFTVTLHGNVHPIPRGGVDLGAAPAGMPAERLMLVLRRSPQQEAALQSYLRSVQDPASPEFHHFVTPEEFGARYGVGDQDLASLTTWLNQHNLSVTRVTKGRTAVEFSGTVGAVQDAFHTTIHRYQVGEQLHWANAADPQIPAALAPAVAGVASLHDFRPRAQAVAGPTARWNPKQHTFSPNLTATINQQQYLFVTPGDAATIYNTPTSLNIHPSGGATLDGTGVTIGVVEDNFPDLGPLTAYQTLFGLNAHQGITAVIDGDRTNIDPNADPTETLLDLEVAQGLAPGAGLALYAAGDTTFAPGVLMAALRAVDDNLVSILSVSYGACESDQGSAGNAFILNTWEQAAAQGITVVVSSGDSGSAGCEDHNAATAASHGLAVNGLASTAYNIAVGGTDFNALSTSYSSYVSSSNSQTYESAKGYIPEVTWNNSTGSTGLLASNTTFTDSKGRINVLAGGGGPSRAGDGSGATLTGYAKPLWQQNYSPSNTDAVRDTPDVSLLSGSGQHNALWAVCLENDCQSSRLTISGVGGTSAAAPAFAGMLALVNQHIGATTRLGQANWVLYRLAQTNPAVFHTIGTSNNSVVCSAGSPDCGTNGFMVGYNTASGYNFATGLGSVDATQLVNAWNNVSLATTATTLALDKTSFVHGTPVTLSVGVTPAGASGDVAVINNASAQMLATGSTTTSLRLPLTSGSGSTVDTQLPGGTYSVFANYGGDGSHAGSTSAGVPVTVTSEDSSVQFDVDTIDSNYNLVSLAGATVPLGTFTVVRAAPVGISQAAATAPILNATGTLLFLDTATGQGRCAANVPVDATGHAEAHFPSCAAGLHTITADYRGDLSYNPSTSAPISFTVLKGSTALSLSSSTNTVSSADQFIFTANFSINPTPAPFPLNGTVTFTNTTTGQVLPNSFISDMHCSTGTCYYGAVGVQASQLFAGPNVITATYSGDNNYSPSPTASIIVTCSADCTNAAGQTLRLAFYNLSAGSFAPGGIATTTVSVNPGGGFTGPVNLSCTVTGKNSADVHLPTCSFNPAQVTITSDQSVTSQLTVTTTPNASAARMPFSPWPGRERGLAAGSTLACVLLLGIRTRRRTWMNVVHGCLCVLALSTLLGCGGGGSSSNAGAPVGTGGSVATGGTTPDTYTVTFTAADAATGTLTAQNYFTIQIF